MKKNKIIGMLLLGLIIICSCNCKDDDENNNPNPNTNKLLGTWITDSNLARNDTIIFNENYYVQNYFQTDSIKYQISNDSIYFTNQDNLTLPCTFVLRNDSLTIHKFSYLFYQLTVIHEDVTFTKSE